MLSHSQYSQDKKQREYQLIEEFLRICPDFKGYTFKSFRENPDMVYERGNKLLGFDSIIIAPDQTVAECYFDESLCKVGIPTHLSEEEKTNKISVFFENKLFSHWRRYSLPTVLVFSLVDTEPNELDILEHIALRFRLPEVDVYNIVDYYLCDGSAYVKVAEN